MCRGGRCHAAPSPRDEPDRAAVERMRGCQGRGLGMMTVVSFQANATFDALGRLRELVELWDELGPRVWDFFQDGPQVEALRVSMQRRRAGARRRRSRPTPRKKPQEERLNPFCQTWKAIRDKCWIIFIQAEGIMGRCRGRGLPSPPSSPSPYPPPPPCRRISLTFLRYGSK